MSKDFEQIARDVISGVGTLRQRAPHVTNGPSTVYGADAMRAYDTFAGQGAQ